MDLQLNPIEELSMALHLSLTVDSTTALEMRSVVVTNVHGLHISIGMLWLEEGAMVSDRSRGYDH